MTAVTMWCGPVNFAQVGSAFRPGSAKVNVTCTGDGSPSCADIAESARSSLDRILPSLLSAHGADPSSPVLLGAFSAGGSIAKRICMSPADRSQIQALYLADASYTTDRAPGGGPSFIEGYVRFALDCLDGPKTMVATASASPNKSWGSGIDVLKATRLEIERRSGRAFESVASLPGSPSTPSWAGRLGGVWFGEYEAVPHGEQATVLAPAIWPAIVNAASAVSAPPSPVVNGSATKLWLATAFAAGAAIGYLGMKYLKRG